MDVGNVHGMPDYGDAQVPATPQWPDGGTTPPPHSMAGQEEPRSVHKKHECPPDRVEMLKQYEALQKRFDERLANQKQVIENLDVARKDALEQIQAWREFGEVLANTDWHQLSPMDLQRQAQSLLSREDW